MHRINILIAFSASVTSPNYETVNYLRYEIANFNIYSTVCHGWNKLDVKQRYRRPNPDAEIKFP